MKTNRPKSVIHVSKALSPPRDFNKIEKRTPFDPFASPHLEIELHSAALKKRLNRLGITQNSTRPAYGLEEK